MIDKSQINRQPWLFPLGLPRPQTYPDLEISNWRWTSVPEDPSFLASIYCSMFIHETWQNTSTDMKHMCFPDTRGMYAKCWPIVRTSTTCGISPCLQHPCGQVRYRSYMCGPFNHSTIAQNCRPMFPSSPVHLSSLFFPCSRERLSAGFFQ